MKEDLLNELLREGENTRKLLKAVPDSALDWKPSSKNWTTAQLASHIAGLYDWYRTVVEMDELNLDTYVYDKGDISSAANIVARFEENFENARKAMRHGTNRNCQCERLAKGAVLRWVLLQRIRHGHLLFERVSFYRIHYLFLG